jgi:hypothetical protein
MSKKARITFNISAIALLIAIGAQSYTNYQIDQTLKQFPYHFRDQFTLQVDETNSDFFTRDLTFSIKHRDNGEKTEFIHTKLTTLPFFINAESNIPHALIKKLNNTLKVTIDKNIITSQFSVFGENLQSDIITQLRDSTNTQQTLETDLMYSPKSGVIDIRTKLSGLNYDANTKIKNLTAETLLNPVGESHYDITKANINIANTDISFLNGDNTRIELENSQFSLNKKIEPTGYDLITSFKNKVAKLSNKSIKSETEKTIIEGLELHSKLLGVPSHVTFYDQLDELHIENININQLVKKILSTLFDNDLFETSIAIKKISDTKEEKNRFTLKDATFSYFSNNKKKEESEQNITMKINEIGMMLEANLLNIKGLNWSYSNSNFNLLEHFDFVYKYLPENINEMSYFKNEKDHPDFLKDLQKLTSNYKTQTKLKFDLKNISLAKYFSLENLSFNLNKEPAESDFNLKSQINFDKLILEKEKVQFTQFNWALPFKISPAEAFYPLYLCSNTYKVLCFNNLSLKTYEKLQHDAFAKIKAQINDSVFNTKIDPIPASKPQQVTAGLKFNWLPPQKKEEPILETLQNAELDFKLTLPTALISDMSESDLSEAAKAKNSSAFWLGLKEFLDPNLNPLMELAPATNGQYEFNFVQKEGKLSLNGKNIEEFEKEKIEQQRLEQERQEKLQAEQQAIEAKIEAETKTADAAETKNTTDKNATDKNVADKNVADKKPSKNEPSSAPSRGKKDKK